MLANAATPTDLGDFDLDGVVAARDFLAWQRSPAPRASLEVWRQNFGDVVLRPDGTATKYAAKGDFDADGFVDSRDFLAWQRGGSSYGPAGLDVWRANFSSTVVVQDNIGASTFTLDLLDRELIDRDVHLSGAGEDDTLVLKNAGFAESVVLSLSGPQAGVLTITTPAGNSDIHYSGVGKLDLGGAIIDVSCIAGLNEEFVVSTSDGSMSILVNGVSSPQLLNVGQIHLHADQGDADSAALIAPPSYLMRIHVDAAHGMTSATTSAADVNLHHFADVRLGEELRLNQATLEIVGTQGSDEWRLTTNSLGDLVTNSPAGVAIISGINAVKFQGGMGDDCLELALSPGVSLSEGVIYEGGGGLNDLIVSGAPITNLRLSNNGQAGTLRAGGTEIAFAGLAQNWVASSMAAQSPSYIVDETTGNSQVAVPIQVGPQNTIREISFAIDPALLGNDRAEFFVVDAANHAHVLLGGPGGAPLLTLSQGGAQYDPARVNYVNSQLHVDISSVASSANAELLVRIMDQDSEASSLVRVQPLVNDLTTGLLTMELPGAADAFHGFTIDGTWLSGSGDFLEVGLVVLDEDGTVDGLSPGDIGFAQIVSSSESRRILFNGEQGIGATIQVVMPDAGPVALYVSHNNPAAAIPSEHIQVQSTGAGSWNVGWEKSQSVFGTIGRRNYDDAVFVLTAAEECSPLLIAGEGDQSGGTIGDGAGTATSDGCVVTLVEGDSFDVDWTSPITIPASGSLTFSFSSLDFDTTDEGFVNDAFEVAMVDANGNSLIRTIEPGRDAFFNITEGEGAVAAQGAIVDGNTVTIGLGGLIPGDLARIIFRLVNNDDDFTTTVQINTLELIDDQIAALAPGGVGITESVEPVGSLGENAMTAGVVTIPTDDVLGEILPGTQAGEDLPALHPDDTPLDPEGSVVFDSPEGFAQGELFNLQLLGSGGIQLSPAGETEFLPLIWVSNSGEGTVSKFDTRTGKELGRYRTSAGGGDPSRIAVTRDGDAWVANRGGAGTVIKVLHDGFIDRNGNGVMDTSQDLNNDGVISGAEILPWDANGDGLPDDERIAFVVQVGGGPRGVAIDANNKVWISPLNGTGFRVFDNDTGQLETIVAAPHGSYGAVIDGDGNLWSATSGGGSTIMRIDTVNRVFVETVQVASAYGITVDQDGIVWTSPWSGRTLSRYDPSTRELTTYPIPATSGGGITVDRQGNVWFGTANSNRVWKFTFAEDRKTLINSESVVVGQNPKSASIDADGYLWTVALSSNNAWKIDTVTNTVVAGPIPTGSSPYNYSDMTGGILLTVTQRSGTWNEIVDAERLDAVWAELDIASTTPEPSVMRARVRTSNDRGTLSSAPWVDVSSTGSLLGLRGRYLEVEVTLESTNPAVDSSVQSIAVRSIPAPTIDILTPANGAVLDSETTVLSGLVVAGQAEGADPAGRLNEIVAVTVDGVAVEMLDAGGHFFNRVSLQPGINRFEVQATDRFGQTTTSTVAVFAGPAPSQVDFSQFSDITGSFTGVYGRTSLNEDDARLYLNLAIRNDGTFDADAPLLIGVTNITDPSVSVLNPDGYTPDGVPYFNYTSVTPDGRLAPNELTLFPTIAFDVPHRERFGYDLVFFGKLNQPPEITTLPDIEALAGRSYVYDVDAVDPDQDVVGFSLLAAPAGMTINPASGVIDWTPQAADVGNYEIVVRADDGRGGAAEQRYTLTVIAPPPNRPPIIVSTPVTMAVPHDPNNNQPTYQYDVNAVDPDDDLLTYSLVAGQFPTGMAIDSATGLISWGPTYAQIGEHDVLVRVEDGRGGVAEQAYVVAVKGDPANNPPVFVSTPITTFQSQGSTNPSQGLVSPGSLNYRTSNSLTVSEIVSLTIPDDGGGEGSADIIFVVDESGSMAGEHAWLTQLIATVDSSLQAEGVTENRFGLVGFANTGRILQAGGDRFMTAANFATAAGQLSTGRSGSEDGYRGIDYALDNYAFRTDAAKAIILVTDEHRTTTDSSLNFQNITTALENAGVYFSLVGNANLADMNGTSAFGVAGDGTSYINDGSGSLLVTTGGVYVDSEPVGNGTIANIKQHYVDLAWGLDGVTWNLNILRDGGQAAQFFSQVFVDVLAEDIVRQLPIDVIASNPNVGFVNLTGILSDVGPGETASFNIQFDGSTPAKFDLTFVRPDTGAILGSIPVNVNGSYYYDSLALDADGDTLTYSKVSGPDELMVNSATGELTWDVTDADIGTHPVTIRVVDGRGGANEQTFEIKVVGGGTGAIRGSVVVDEVGSGADPADGPVLLLTPNGLGNTVGPAIAAAGFEIIVARQEPNAIASQLAVRPDIDQIWIWNDRSDRGGGSSEVPVNPDLAFTSADLEALAAFSATHDEWIMDGLSWRTHATESERNLTANEAIALATTGGGIVLGADNGPATGVTNSITQHVNQVAAHFGFELFIGAYSTPASIQFEGGRLFDQPNPVDPSQLTSSTTSYAELPHGLQANGIYLETAVFGSPSSSFGGPSSPPLQPDTFSGQTYASVNHILTSSIAGVGFDREGIPNWVVYIDQNENGIRDPGERFTITDANGNYEFTGLPADEYIIREDPQVGWRQTAPVGDQHVVTLPVGGAVVGIDFGNVQSDVGNNTQPRFTSTPLTAATALSAYLYDANAVDDQGDLLEFTLAASPAGMTINPQTGVVGWLPTLNQVGTHDVLLRVTDSGGLSSVQSFTVEVLPFNTAPVFTSTPPATAVVGRPLAYQAAAQDAQGDVLTFAKVTGPSALTVNPTTGLIEWTPGAAEPAGVTIRVTDGRGGEALQTFTLDVAATAPNKLPEIISTPRTITRLGRTYVYMVDAADADFDPLTYSLTSKPAGMTIDEDTGAIMWSPAPGDVASPHPVAVSVSDGRGGTATQSFELQVIQTDVNTPPLIVTAAKTAARTDILYSYDAAAFDADDDELLWSLTTAPIGMSIDAMTGTIRWTPVFQQAGEHEVVLQVTDAVGATATQSFTIHVDCVNGSPLITSVPLTRAVAEADYYYGVRATDPNGDPLEFRFGNATSATLGMTIDERSGLIRWTPSAAHVGSHEIVIVAQDPYGAFATQRYTVFVEPEFDGQGESNRNRPPRITSTPTFAAEVDVPYSYQVVAEDVDGDALVYEFGNPAEIPAGLELDENTGLVTWTPTIDNVGNIFVAIVVRDPHGAVASQAFSIAVRDNLAPEITSEPIDEAFAGATYRYDVRAIDPEGDPLTFTLDAGPEGMTIDPLGRIVWKVPSGAIAAPVTITVADDRGQTDTQSFVIDILQDTTAPRVFIFAQAGPVGVADGGRVDIGSTVVLTVTATDNVGVETLALSINGTAVGLDANGQATVQAQVIGNLTALATAMDAAGNTGQAQLVVQIVDPASPNTPAPTNPNLPPHPGFDPTDNQGPTVIITSPEFGDSVTNRTPIVGTIDDPEDNLWYWRVYVARADRVSLTAIDLDDPDYAVIAEGTNEVHAAEIATLDPTLLTNDPYTILVAAFDVNGRGYVQPTLVNIEGAAKIGEFRLEFTDLSIPLAGLPIQITRVYDSREAPTVGDFGHGWSLGVQDARILEIAAIGEGGAFNPGNDTFIPGKTKVYLTNPSGQRVGFTYQEQLISASFFGGVWRPYFVPDPGVYDTLTIDETQVARGGIIGALAQGINPDNYTLTTKDGIKYRYNQSSGLEKITDRSGNTITFTEAGIFHDSSGVSIDFVRDSRGRITQIIDPDGGVIRYEYNLAGDLVRVTNQAGIDSTYVYLDDPAHFLDEGFDDNGNRDFKVTYDDDNRFKAIIDAMGNVIQEQNYDELENNRAIIRDANNNETHLLYNDRGNVLEETDASGRTTYYEYSDPLNPDLETRIIDRDGNVTERAYDSRGNVTRIVELGPQDNPLGTGIVTEFTYDSRNDVTSITNANGVTTVYNYDVRGNHISTLNSNGNLVEYEYDAQGRPKAFKDLNGNTTQFVYNAPDCGCAYPREVIFEDGTRQTFEHNQFGQAIRESYLEADGTVVEETFREYDASGRLIEERDGVGNIRRMIYDGELLDWEVIVNPLSLDGLGQLTESPSTPVAQRRSQITDYEYDANDRLIRQTDAQGGVVEFRYDAQGNRILLQDPVGNITTWVYDVLNRVVEERDPFFNEGMNIDQALAALAMDSGGSTTTNTPAAHVTLFAYDGEGNLIEEIDRNGRRREMDYDHAGRLLEEEWYAAGTDNLVESIAYTYDTLGNLLTAQDSHSRYNYTYDALNRVRSVDNFDGDPTTPDVVLSYEYDARGNVTKTYDNDGVTVESTYNQRNLLATRKWYDGDVPVGENPDVADARIDFAYNAAGRQTRVDRYSDLLAQNRVGSTVTSHDLAGRTDVLRHQNAVDALLSQYDYGYDFGGLVSSEVRDHTQNQYDQNILYGYDLTGQLVDAAFSGQSDETFLYDANGNRIRSTNGGVVTNYTTGVANQLTSNGTYTYEYDGEGNQIKRRNIATGETTTYQYDHHNRLVRVDDWSSDPGDPNSPAAGAILTQSVEYTYDALGRRISRSVDADGVDSAATEKELFAYNGDNVWADFNANGDAVARYLFGNRIDSNLGRSRVGEGTVWYLTDSIGSVRDLINNVGTVLNHNTFSAYGILLSQFNNQFSDRFGFGARELSHDSASYFSRARFYDARQGRFMNFDPAGFEAGDNNLYRYVSNNPSGAIDPTGENAIIFYGLLALLAVGIVSRFSSCGCEPEPTDPCNKCIEDLKTTSVFVQLLCDVGLRGFGALCTDVDEELLFLKCKAKGPCKNYE